MLEESGCRGPFESFGPIGHLIDIARIKVERADVFLEGAMVSVSILAVGLAAAVVMGSHNATDEAAIRQLLEEETTAWNNSDAEAYARHFAVDGTCTPITGGFFTGRDAFRQSHEQIFKGIYRGSTKHGDLVSLKFVRADVAIVETLETVTGFQKLPPGISPDAKGRLRARLLQVLVKNGGEWQIATYHNVDVKAGVNVPEPQ
jgi:uncharacterized protein (TIGR02246 family)